MGGAIPGKRNVPLWRQMREGDLVIPYRKKHFKGLFRIIGKVHNRKFAERLWGKGQNPDNMEETWEYMYFLDLIDRFDIPSHRVYFGHSGPLSQEDGEKLWSRISSHVNVNFIKDEDKTDEQLEREIEQQMEKGDYRVEDSWGEQKQRIGQDKFREKVLENFQNKCCICGINVPELLDASHIHSWADDKDNRLNPRNGLALCALHHRAVERGILTIDKNGQIHCDKGSLSEDNDVVAKFLLAYDGKYIRKPSRYTPLLL